MIIVKVINQKVVQVAFAKHTTSQVFSTILSTRNNKQLTNIARCLVQSTSQNQKVTSANNQQLIPIARNISFRQCEQSKNTKTNAQASFSISASSPTSQFISLDESLFDEREERLSPLESLKKKAKNVVEKRETNAKNTYYGQSLTLSAPTTERRLVVLMSWLKAKEKHIEKYRQFYLDRGFDVLNVKTSPRDLLFPTIGAKKISKDFIRFMAEKQYSNVVVHGFSVGGYMFGEVLLELEKMDAKVKQNFIDSIHGVIFDSMCPLEGLYVGVARSMTNSELGSKLLANVLKFYLFLTHNFATKHYIASSKKVWEDPLKCPALFLQSTADPVSDYKVIENLENGWKRRGVDTRRMLVDGAPHVQLYQMHRDEYVKYVEKFLERIKMN